MAFPYKLQDQAHEEYIEAYDWYELRQIGLGDRFMQSVEKRLKQICEFPENYGKKQSNRFREAKVEGFPYMIVYEFLKLKGIVHITSIYHGKRSLRWKYRKME